MPTMNVTCERTRQVFAATSRSAIAACLRQTFARRGCITAALVTTLLALSQWSVAQTALDTYVAAPDASYGFTPVATINDPACTGYHIDLTSQTWRDPSEVTHNLWQHPMTITQPGNLALNPAGNTAILFIGGGSSTSDYELLEDIAVPTGAVVVNLPVVPNQPLQFAGEGLPRTEDQIIAKTFAKFLDNDPSDSNVSQWPLLLPMVKSAVAAMDATQTHMQNQGVTIDNFVVMGGSKRGWTTWLTAAVDDRVSAIVPAVIDVLNIDESMEHHRMSYEGVSERLLGGYSLAVGDYVVENVFDRLGTPRGQELLSIVDPFEYRDRLVDMPKYIVNSTGDQFFVPDSSQFYYGELGGEENYLRYMPNTDHGLNDDAFTAALTFYRATSLGVPLPDFSWDISADGTSITVNTVDSPLSVLMWEATNPDNRDFRQATFGDLHGGLWDSSPLSDQGGGQYIANISVPATGATAFLVELTYDVGGLPMTFTTEVSVAQVPEPTSCALMLSGFLVSLLCVFRVRRGREGTP